MTVKHFPNLGFGLGLRTEHYQDIIEQKPPIDWFEVLSENYLVPGGRPLYYLDRIRQDYQLAMHGVSMSIGSVEPLNFEYLKQLKQLADRIQPAWISDHLCWTGVNKVNLHDLMPLPYTEEAVQHVVARIQTVQDFLQRPLVLENVSSYVTYNASMMSEWEFLAHIVEQADCYILLDVNNVYVSAFNHSFEAKDYLNAMPRERVVQFHVAGHTNLGTHIIDTHDAPIIDPVWQLYEYAVQRFPNVSTLIERDDNIPPLHELLQELKRARNISQAALKQAEAVW